MALPDEWKTKSAGVLEQWLMEALERDDRNIAELVAVLEHLAQAHDPVQADALAEMAQDIYAELNDRQSVLRLLSVRLAWPVPGRDEPAVCRKTVESAFSDRWGKAFAEAVDLGGALPPEEIVRRLTVLTGMRAGGLCNDKTWGFGIIREIDDFYKRVTIDFDTKPRHRMTFAYAAETLELLDAEHLLAVKHAAPGKVAEMVKSAPAELVKAALRSFGPLAVPDLQQRLVPAFMAEKDWKGFWDAARKELKRDALVDVPARRSEPLRLLETALVYDDAWAAKLAQERDIGEIMRGLDEALAGGLLENVGDSGRDKIGERLAYVLHACENSQPGVAARALVQAERCNVPDTIVNVAAVVHGVVQSGRLETALNELPAREVSGYLDLLIKHSGDESKEALLEMLPRMPCSLMDAIVAVLRANAYEAQCAERLGGILNAVQAPPLVVDWAWRRYGQNDEWIELDAAALLQHAVAMMERDLSGEELKAQNDLRSRLEQGDALVQMLGKVSGNLRESFVQRVNSARGWDTGSRRSVMARVIKLYPELLQVIAGDDEKEPAVEAKRVTSWRSYRERQEQLRDIVECQIPENSQEIGVARSYGDLRENFEYQAAKDRQRLLMQRQATLEQDLKDVQGTDFSDASVDKAGPGCSVVLCGADGRNESITILGEWDRDEVLGIISNKSRVGTALCGRSVGDEVQLPAEGGIDGELRTVKIVSIEPLNTDLRGWIGG